jgi:glycosyltransferase involved in cell wall biosynthesis
MHFSFIIPCYNESDDIEDTVKSCINQDYNGEFEILLIDDGSKDNTLEIINRLSRTYGNIRALNYEQNKGVSFARNYGVKKAQGEVVIFLNADEIPQTDFLTRLEKYYGRGADYFFPQTEVSNQNFAYGLYRQAFRRYKYPQPNLLLWSQGFSCKKEVILKVGGFNDKYPGCGGEDWDLVTKIEELGLNRVVDFSVVVKHKVPDTKNKIVWHMFNRGRGTANFQLIRKNINPYKVILKSIMVAIVFLLVAWKYVDLILFSFCYLGYKHLIISYEMAKNINSQNKYVQITTLYLLEKIVRKVGYNYTIIKKAITG